MDKMDNIDKFVDSTSSPVRVAPVEPDNPYVAFDDWRKYRESGDVRKQSMANVILTSLDRVHREDDAMVDMLQQTQKLLGSWRYLAPALAATFSRFSKFWPHLLRGVLVSSLARSVFAVVRSAATIAMRMLLFTPAGRVVSLAATAYAAYRLWEHNDKDVELIQSIDREMYDTESDPIIDAGRTVSTRPRRTSRPEPIAGDPMLEPGGTTMTKPTISKVDLDEVDRINKSSASTHAGRGKGIDKYKGAKIRGVGDEPDFIEGRYISPDARMSGNFEQVITSVMDRAGMHDPIERAHFLAQTAHETGRGNFLSEIWGPTAQQKKYDDPNQKLSKWLGNTQKGDGFKYRGRGFIQLTGRANYQAASDYLGIDLIANPDLVSTSLEVAAATALWYWNVYRPRTSKAAKTHDVEAVTRVINGGVWGLSDRIALYRHYIQQTSAGGVYAYKPNSNTVTGTEMVQNQSSTMPAPQDTAESGSESTVAMLPDNPTPINSVTPMRVGNTLVFAKDT